MKKLVVLLVVSLMATAAFAVNDPTTDSFGIYFGTTDLDTGEYILADNTVNCTTGATGDEITMYVVLMNPAGVTDAAEFTIVRTPSTATSYTAWFIEAMVADWLDVDSTALGVAAGGSPCPIINGGMAMFHITYNVKAVSGVPIAYSFAIKKATNASIIGSLLPAVSGGGVLRSCGVASGDVNLPVATVNNGCPVPAESATFGSVKSLFR